VYEDIDMLEDAPLNSNPFAVCVEDESILQIDQNRK